MKTSLLTLLVLAACASERPVVRFANAPATHVVDDRTHVPAPPAARPFPRALYYLRGYVVRRVTRGLEVPRPQRARGVNALDEVPSSTWFTNRIGVRDLSPEDVARGAAVVGSPEPHVPWTIKSTKVGGASVGFIIKDARGEKYVLKFDELGFDEVETAADAITSRLVWAAGYNTPEDHVVYFRKGDLVLAPDAVIADGFGNKRPLRRAELEKLLAKIQVSPDGKIRGLASRFLDGKWLGGHSVEGVREDDPNDRIPHELRRDLRGAYAIYSWLDHIDIKEDNFLDMWVEDPEVPGRHYVKHYAIDFGKALGAMAMIEREPRAGKNYTFDAAQMVTSFASAGLALRDWETRRDPELRGVGLFDAESFVPDRWKAYNPSYLPLRIADRVDNFWGAKIVMRFTREQIRAAVATGRLGDPKAADYLVDTLVARQRMVGRHWFTQTNPLDRFALDGTRLCFDDLLLAYDLAAPGTRTHYAVGVTDRDGRTVAQAPQARLPLQPDARGHACTQPLALPADGDGYSIIRVRTRRGDFDMSTYVHVARHAQGLRIIGIWRQ